MFERYALKSVIAPQLMNNATLDLCSDASGTTVTGTNYSSKTVTYSSDDTSKMFAYDNTNDCIYNAETIWFPDAESNWGTVSHVKLSKTVNNVTSIYFIGALTSPINIVEGDRIRFNAGDFKITFTQTIQQNNQGE